MPERFEIYIWRNINTLPFLPSFEAQTLRLCSLRVMALYKYAYDYAYDYDYDYDYEDQDQDVI